MLPPSMKSILSSFQRGSVLNKPTRWPGAAKEDWKTNSAFHFLFQGLCPDRAGSFLNVGQVVPRADGALVP